MVIPSRFTERGRPAAFSCGWSRFARYLVGGFVMGVVTIGAAAAGQNQPPGPFDRPRDDEAVQIAQLQRPVSRPMHRSSRRRPIAERSRSSFATSARRPVSEAIGSTGRDPSVFRQKEYSRSIRDGIPPPAVASRVTGLMAEPVPAVSADTEQASITLTSHPSRQACMQMRQRGWRRPIGRASVASPLCAAGLPLNESSNSVTARMRVGRTTET